MKTFRVKDPVTAAHKAAMRAAFSTGTSKHVDDANADEIRVIDSDGTLLAVFAPQTTEQQETV
jgi:hypothetical protein